MADSGLLRGLRLVLRAICVKLLLQRVILRNRSIYLLQKMESRRSLLRIILEACMYQRGNPVGNLCAALLQGDNLSLIHIWQRS